MSEQYTHELKILPEYFDAVQSGKKNFELRKNDRDYRCGDILLLREWKDGEYTGRTVKRKITYILTGCQEYGLAEDYCILAMKIVHRTRCMDCKHHNGEESSIGIECTNPAKQGKFKTDIARFKSKWARACKDFEAKEENEGEDG